MAARNRTEGYRWERLIAQMLRNSGIYPNAVTCRSTNRTRDWEGIDFCNENEAVHGRMQDDIQAKTTVDTPKLEALLQAMRSHDTEGTRIPAVFWRKTGKSKAGKFMEKGRFAVTFLEDYLRLLRYREAYMILRPYVAQLIQSLQDSEQQAAIPHIVKRLAELDLMDD